MNVTRVAAVPSSRSWEFGEAQKVIVIGREARIVAVHMEPTARVEIRAYGERGLVAVRSFDWRPAVAMRAGDRRAFAEPIVLPTGGVVEVRAGRAPLRGELGVVTGADLRPVIVGVEVSE